jgi:FixJ family two-component response regulator
MPAMNGRELAEKMLTIYPNLKIMFISGYTADIIAHHGKLDEKANFLQKPFSKHDLAVKIGETLEK